MPCYKEKFSVGAIVRIAAMPELQEFKRKWKYHNKLSSEQLLYADTIARITSIAFYHGGDVLYELESIPGVWHEQCIHSLPPSGEADDI